MALQKTTVQVPFGQGIETKQDSKLVIPGKLLVLENGELDQLGSITKRNGYDILSRTVQFSGSGMSGSISSGSALATFKDELVLMDGTKFYTRSQASGSWIFKGELVPVNVETDLFDSDLGSQTSKNGYGVASTNGVTVYAWRNSVIYAVIVDQATGAKIWGPNRIDTAGSNQVHHPKCVTISSSICVVWDDVDAGELTMRTLDTNNVSQGFGSEITLVTDVSGAASLNATFDVKPWDSTKGCLVYATATGGRIRHFTTLTASTTQSRAFAHVGGVPRVVTAVQGTNGVWHVPYWETGSASSANAISSIGFNNDATLTVAYPSKSIDFNDLFLSGCIGMTAVPEGDGYRLFHEIGDGNGTARHFVRTVAVNATGSYSLPAIPHDLMRGVGLASQAFSYKGNSYVNVAYESTLQSTYFTVTASGSVVSRILPGRAGGMSDDSWSSSKRYSQVAEVSSGTFVWMGLEQVQKSPNSQNNLTYTAQTSIKLDFANAKPQAVEIADALHIAAGGMLYMYDGDAICEHGFHLFPETLLSSGTITGGDLTDGTYAAYLAFEWYDNAGRVHRSAPAVKTVTLAGGGNDQRFTIRYPTLRMSEKGPAPLAFTTPISVRGYRTEVNGQVPYYETAGSSDYGVVGDQGSMTFSELGTNIASNAQLYTFGGGLEHIAAPAVTSLATKGNRLFAYDGENTVWYSKKVVDGEGVGLSDFLVTPLDPAGGKKGRLAELDGTIVVIKEKNIQAGFAGDGPSDAGGDDINFNTVTTIASDVGAVAGSPTVSTDQGVFFVAGKGICLLARGEQVQFVGAPVAAYATASFTSAVLVPEKQQVRFTTAGNVALVYDYYTSQWSAFTGHEAKDATVWQGKYCFLKEDGRVFVQNTASFEDGGSAINLVAETAWITLKDRQDFQRIYRVALLGEWRSACTVTLNVYYDYSNTVAETVSFDASTGYTVGDPLQLLHHLKKQKCEAIKFRISDSNQAGTKEGITITALGLQVGMKQGLFKGPQNKVV